MRKLMLIALTLLGGAVIAQVQVPIQTIVSGGAITMVNGSTVTGFGNMGQPLVFARPAATSNGGGVMMANNIMFSSSTVDSEPPQITSISPFSITINATANFTSTITDNFQSSLNATLYYRPIASNGVFKTIQLDKSGTSFTKEITTAFYNNGYDDVGMEYYVEANDANATVRSPLTGSLYTYVTNPAAQVTASLLSYGDKPKNYRMISIPYNISGAVTQVFTDLPGLDKTKYRLWEYDTESDSWTEYADFNTIDRARGYFIIMNSSQSDINLTMGSQQAETNNRSTLATLYDMVLQPGWNLIGNPYTVPIDWDEVRTLNGNPAAVGTELKVWGGSADAGAYSNLTNGELAPFQGAFVFLNGTSIVTLDIPFKGATVGGRIAEEFTTNLASSKWRLPIVLEQAGNEYTMSALGMHPDAELSYDPFDDLNPPSFVETMELNFQHPEHAQKAFSRDVVPTNVAHVWRFNAKTSGAEPVTLRWNNTGFGDNEIELYLYDLRTNAIINMREENHYTFSADQSKEFKIYFGIDIRERIGPDAITVDEPHPNPFNSGTPVEFVVGLPDNLITSYDVDMIIHNSMGQPIHKSSRQLAPGLHTLTWSGRKADQEQLTAGFYFYTIKVGERNFTGKILYTHEND